MAQQNGQQMNPTNGIPFDLSGVDRFVNMIKNSKDPKAFIMNEIQNNPYMKKAIEYVNQNGGDPKAAAFKLAKEKGYKL